MKLLSIAIPSYNSQDYLEKCVQSLLVGGEEVEILIVNDGSKDATPEIADRYAKEYPTIVKAIHQENGGHGEAVNAGIRNATGLYFKVVDSDDWVDESAYKKILDTLRELVTSQRDLDLLISNYVYEKEGAKHKKVMRYRGILPENRMFTWDETKYFKKGQYMMMHSLIYRTQLLRDCGLELPKHTFYVDNLFLYVPLPYVKNLYYLNVDFYRYYIGREGQSVNEAIMIRRIDQQMKVNKLMLESMNVLEIPNKKLRRYLYNHLEIVTVISTILCIRSGSEENLAKSKALWEYIKDYDPNVYEKLRKGIMGRALHIPGKFGRTLAVTVYRISRKIFGFN